MSRRFLDAPAWSRHYYCHDYCLLTFRRRFRNFYQHQGQRATLIIMLYDANIRQGLIFLQAILERYYARASRRRRRVR